MHIIAIPAIAQPADVGQEEISPVRRTDAVDLSCEISRSLSSSVNTLASRLLTNPGFSHVRIEYLSRDGSEKVICWSPSSGVSYLPSASSVPIAFSVSSEERWTLKIGASVLLQWIAVDEAQSELAIFASALGEILDSLIVRKEIRETYQSTDYWYGHSKALCELEQQIRKLARTRLPIALIGEKGTGKLPAALTLHCYRHAQFAPFVHADCRKWVPGTAAHHLDALLASARGGSLYLAHADSLKGADQTYLRDFSAKLVQDLSLMFGSRTSVQSVNLENESISSFNEWIEFHCLSVKLPRFQERVQDIKAFAESFLFHANLTVELSDDAWELLQNYAWPENGTQLQAVLSKAAILAEGELNASHLLDWFPSLQADLTRPSASLRSDPEDDVPPKAVQNTLEERRDSIFAWFGLKQPENEHPALIRALDYIWKHYQQALTLDEVAAKACVSSSHLSYLFKKRLERPFKQILTDIRIDKAKHIFENLPARQITQVCMDVGFADLSHFEKTFKRMVGQKPRCYRQQFRAPLSTQL